MYKLVSALEPGMQASKAARRSKYVKRIVVVLGAPLVKVLLLVMAMSLRIRFDALSADIMWWASLFCRFGSCFCLLSCEIRPAHPGI